MQPAAQQPAAHRGRRPVEHRQQRVAASTGEIAVDLQVAAGGAVEQHAVVAVLHLQPLQMGQLAALGGAGIVQQRPGSADGQPQPFAAETGQAPGAELARQCGLGTVMVELPVRTLPQQRLVRLGQREAQRLIDQQLGRLQPPQLFDQRRRRLGLAEAKAATAQLQAGDAEALAIAADRHQQVLAVRLQQCFITDGPGRHHPHHLALHRPLAAGGIADLLADRHRQPQPGQLGQITLGRMVRHTRHWNRLPGRLPAAGQRDAEQLRGLPGVIVEQLVKVPHAVKQQGIGVLHLQPQILLHHRRVLLHGTRSGQRAVLLLQLTCILEPVAGVKL